VVLAPHDLKSPVLIGQRRRRNRIRLALWILLSLFAVAGVTAVVLVWATSSPSGGDPGDQSLHTLHSDVLAAIPSGATNVSVNDYPTTWQSKCPDNPSGRAGWASVRVDASFSTSQPGQAITDTVGAALATKGWTRRGDRREWLKATPKGSPLDIVLTRDNSDDALWDLYGSWLPPGSSLPGC